MGLEGTGSVCVKFEKRGNTADTCRWQYWRARSQYCPHSPPEIKDLASSTGRAFWDQYASCMHKQGSPTLYTLTCAIPAEGWHYIWELFRELEVHVTLHIGSLSMSPLYDISYTWLGEGILSAFLYQNPYISIKRSLTVFLHSWQWQNTALNRYSFLSCNHPQIDTLFNFFVETRKTMYPRAIYAIFKSFALNLVN